MRGLTRCTARSDFSGVRSDALWVINGQTQAITGPADLGASDSTTSTHGVAVNSATDTVTPLPGNSLPAVADPVTSTVYIAGGDVWVVTPSTTTVYPPVFHRAGHRLPAVSHSPRPATCPSVSASTRPGNWPAYRRPVPAGDTRSTSPRLMASVRPRRSP